MSATTTGATSVTAPSDLDAFTDHDMVGAALDLAALGLSVFPIHTVSDHRCSCGKATCANVAKHPVADLAPHGLHDATIDGATVRQWWALWPDANVGVATGAVSQICVLDIDPDHGGWDSVDRISSQYSALDLDTWTVETGGGGVHLYLRHPGVRVPNNARTKLGAGVDVRGDGGYVVAPPSLHRSGRRYRWADRYDPASRPLCDPPSWLVGLIADRADVPAPAPTLGADNVLAEGSRNATLASLAGSMRRRGLFEPSILAALVSENALRCRPPLPRSEVEAIARSIARYAPAPEVEPTPLLAGLDLRPIRGGGRRHGRR
jgi:hypothetical protein